jgi:bisphosphoglycerate-independent phosphoglycerate mutase (AlkP superfamily)
MSCPNLSAMRTLAGMFKNLPPDQRGEMETKLSEILAEEIDREHTYETVTSIIRAEEARGVYSFAFFDREDDRKTISDKFLGGQLRPDIVEWLQQNLASRFKIIENEKFARVDFGTDKEAAAMFKLFWL